jgi:hypothetical protein
MSDATRTTLDPVCLALLADPRPRRAIDVLRVALATLAAANHILIDSTPGGERFVRVQRAPGPNAPAHLVTVYRALRDAARSGQLSRAATQAALAQAFGTRFTRYADAEVAPALEARGLLRIETRRRLWVFSSRQMQRTASGDALAARLTRRVAELDTLPQLVDSNPARALRLARAAGPLLLLSPHARSSIPRLQALAVTALPGNAHALIDEPEPEWLELFEHAETLLSIDFDILLDAIEAIASFGDDASSGTSTDSDAGGGDGGGGGD